MKTPPLITIDWLQKHLQDKDMVLLDARMNKAQSGSSSTTPNELIPGTRFFDIKHRFSDQDGMFPNTFPSAEQFEKECQALGINKDSHIVVYDAIGCYSSPRVWWMFKTMGHEKVSVLNGGLPAWIDKKLPTDKHYKNPTKKGSFKARLITENIKEISSIKDTLTSKNCLVIDARSKGRFEGSEKEPREGLRSGNIPSSINIPYSTVLTNGHFKSTEALTQVFERATVESQPLIFSCGSGITACIVLFAAHLVLENSLAVYDGSWTEWATLVDEKEFD